jgi:hypothetical protein
MSKKRAAKALCLVAALAVGSVSPPAAAAPPGSGVFAEAISTAWAWLAAVWSEESGGRGLRAESSPGPAASRAGRPIFQGSLTRGWEGAQAPGNVTERSMRASRSSGPEAEVPSSPSDLPACPEACTQAGPEFDPLG